MDLDTFHWSGALSPIPRSRWETELEDQQQFVWNQLCLDSMTPPSSPSPFRISTDEQEDINIVFLENSANSDTTCNEDDFDPAALAELFALSVPLASEDNDKQEEEDTQSLVFLLPEYADNDDVPARIGENSADEPLSQVFLIASQTEEVAPQPAIKLASMNCWRGVSHYNNRIKRRKQRNLHRLARSFANLSNWRQCIELMQQHTIITRECVELVMSQRRRRRRIFCDLISISETLLSEMSDYIKDLPQKEIVLGKAYNLRPLVRWTVAKQRHSSLEATTFWATIRYDLVKKEVVRKDTLAARNRFYDFTNKKNDPFLHQNPFFNKLYVCASQKQSCAPKIDLYSCYQKFYM